MSHGASDSQHYGNVVEQRWREQRGDGRRSDWRRRRGQLHEAELNQLQSAVATVLTTMSTVSLSLSDTLLRVRHARHRDRAERLVAAYKSCPFVP